MNAKRGRKAIKPSIKGLIFEKALKDKGMPRLALAVELKNLIEEMGEIPPSEETMMRLISKARNHPVRPLDKPWSTASLVEYPIPPEVLPVVFQVWVYAREKMKVPLTIREALWAGRLSGVIKDIPWLTRFARGHSITEIVGEISGTNIVSSNFDLALFSFFTGKEISIERQTQILNVKTSGEDTYEEVKSMLEDSKGVHHERSHNKEG